MIRGAHLFALFAALFAARGAFAVEIQTGGTPVRLDITTTSIAAFSVDNLNPTSCDDFYGSGIERLNLSGSWEQWVAGVRVDGSVYYPRPLATAPGATGRRCLDIELESRFQNTLTPEKVWVGYNSRHFEVTLGDSYVQFGRGLSLSLRKTDELGLDTTQRGARVKLNTELLSATLVAGVTNINNIDEASGRYAFDPNDGVAGLTADLRLFDKVRVGGNAVAYLFQSPVSSISAPGVDEIFQERWIVGGPKIEAPRLTEWLGVYLEGVAQQRMPIAGEAESGFGLYGSATAYLGDTTVLVEGKAYGDLAVVQPNFEHLEFDPVQYTALPTLERVTQPIEHPQRNIYGGRVRADWAMNANVVFYANEAVFRDFEGFIDPETFESVPGTIHDPYVGVDANFTDFRVNAQAGTRFVVARGQMLRNDVHGDVNVVRGLSGGQSLEAHAIHWERSEVQPFGPVAWREGTFTVGYRNRPKFAVGAVLDYTTEPGQPALFYPGVTGEWDFTEASILRIFAGSSRGGLRCVSGVCRIFPPFSGVKGTLTLRY